MELTCGNEQINIRGTNMGGGTQYIERAYLKQFDGATVKYVSRPEGDNLIISIKE